MAGISLSIFIALISMGLSSLHPSLDSLVLSIILGMLTGNIFEKRAFLEKGLNICIRFFLPAGIILYGSQLMINVKDISYLVLVPAVFIFTFAITFLVSRTLRINRELALLLSTGLSICGASAIAVVSALIGSKKEETSLSIISIMVVGLIGLIIYPLFSSNSGLSNEGFAFLTGTTLPMLGQVKVVGKTAGPHALVSAVNYKLIRISLLIFLIIWFGLLRKETKPEVGFISFPYVARSILVAGFILLVILTNTLKTPDLQKLLEPFSRFFLTVTLSAIGLSIDFDSIAEIGPRPLYSGLISWFITVLIVYMIGLYYV
jgi:uncharacterized integral membrane protein (TIGR00698 family)